MLRGFRRARSIDLNCMAPNFGGVRQGSSARSRARLRFVFPIERNGDKVFHLIPSEFPFDDAYHSTGAIEEQMRRKAARAYSGKDGRALVENDGVIDAMCLDEEASDVRGFSNVDTDDTQPVIAILRAEGDDIRDFPIAWTTPRSVKK